MENADTVSSKLSKKRLKVGMSYKELSEAELKREADRLRDREIFYFLLGLADLLEENNATLDYTIHDDGIHIRVGESEVFVGFLSENAADALRLAAKKFE